MSSRREYVGSYVSTIAFIVCKISDKQWGTIARWNDPKTDTLPQVEAMERARHVSFLIALAALWLLNRPYFGIWHDAILYTFQAFHFLYPEAYTADPFFSYASQDDYSIFSPLYAFAIRWLGVNAASQMLVLIGAILWLGSAWHLARAYFDRRWSRLLLLTMAALPFYYSSGHTLRMGEGFVTARIFAEALTMLALAQLARAHAWRATTLAFLATAVHPLLGIWGVALCIWQVIGGRRTVLIAIGVAVLLTVLHPNTVLAWLHPMDPHWRTLVRDTAGIVFIDNWTARDWSNWSFFLSVIAYTSISPSRLRYIMAPYLALAITGLALSAMVTYGYPAELVVKAQPWRVLWLAGPLGYIAVVEVFRRAAIGSQGDRLMAMAFLISWTGIEHGGGGAALVVTAVVAVMMLRKGSDLAPLMAKLYPWGVLATSIAMLLWLLNLHIDPSDLMAQMLAEQLPFAGTLLAVGMTGQAGLIPIMAWWGLESSGQRTLGITFVLSVAALALAGTLWDWRSEENRYRETQLYDPTQQHPFAQFIPHGAVVYWEQDPMRVWFNLRTASYISSEQATDIVFSQAKAYEVERRLRSLVIAGPQAMRWSYRTDQERIRRAMENSPDDSIVNLHLLEPDTLTPEGFKYLCSDPKLDFIVSQTKVQNWPLTHYLDKQLEKTYWLYDCHTLRNMH